MKSLIFSLFLAQFAFLSPALADGITCQDGQTWQYDTCGGQAITPPAPQHEVCKKGLNYECISLRLQRLNSSIFNAMTPAEIDEVLVKKATATYSTVVDAMIACQIGE